MHDLDTQKAERLAALSADELGRSEEDVKINFAVPLLELLGHARLRFEHRNKDIVLRHGLPPGTTVIVETKRAATPLDRHLDQVARYAAEERALLALLTNGDELRLYAPLWPQAPTFAHTLLWTLARTDLAHPPALYELAAVLGADALASGHALPRIEKRQAYLRKLWDDAAAIRGAAQQQREQIGHQLAQFSERTGALQTEIEGLQDQLARVDAEEAATLGGLYGAAGETPIEPPAPKPKPKPKASSNAKEPSGRAKPPPPVEPGRRVDWSEHDLYGRATEYQRAILAAFVRTGTRSLHTGDLGEAAGITAHQAMGAAQGFRQRTRAGFRDTLIEITFPRYSERQRRGVILTITDKYWPLLQRLYGEK